jgi:hypothetical protein
VDPRLVFVCSRLAGDIHLNISLTAHHCRYVFRQGLVPVAPHLYLGMILDDNRPAEREMGIGLGREVMNLCSQFWAFHDGGLSSGMQDDINYWIATLGRGGGTVRRIRFRCEGFGSPIYTPDEAP